MRRLAILFCCLLAAGAAAAGAGAVPIFGVAEDATKFADDGGASFFQKLQQLGMTENRMIVYFDPSAPTAIQEKAFLARSVPVAARFGVHIVFSVYPRTANAFATDTDARIAQYAEYLKLLARTYPQVRHFILLNEPNEAFFQAPQFSGGQNVSAEVAFKALAAGYDALKSVDPGITAVGLGLSPEANDTSSTSPVRFIKALGDAYRKSGRTTPIMDELGFHIYPRDASKEDASTKYQWPNVGPADLDRVKQAIWDAFNGTGQPTFEETLRFKIDEMGWQVAILAALAARYTDSENVPVTDEARQALVYADLLRRFACDPTIAEILIFHLLDEVDLRRFQSGLLRVDASERVAFAAVQDAIRQAASCARTFGWTHTTKVLGAKGTFESGDKPAAQKVFGATATAEEDANGKAGIFRVASRSARFDPEKLGAALEGAVRGVRGPVLKDEKLVKAYFSPRFEFRGQLPRGYYVVVVRLRAAMNPSRVTTLAGPIFKVGR